MQRISPSVIAVAAFLAIPSVGSAQLDNTGIWRLQVRTHTCDLTNAGTDDAVFVDLNGTRFFLDNGGNDRERNEWNTYDVVVSGVTRVSHIARLRFGKGGGDAWCIDDAQIFVNSNTIVDSATVDASFLVFDAVRTARWTDGDGSFPAVIEVASSSTLRSSALWNLSGARTKIDDLIISIPALVIERLLEGLLGDKMSNPAGSLQNYKWGARDGRAYVELSHPSTDPENRVRVDLDLAMQNGGITEFRDIDVDFWMTATCDASVSPALLEFAASHVDADAGTWLNVLTVGIAEAIANFRSGGMQLSQTVNTPFCPPAIRFGSDGTLSFL